MKKFATLVLLLISNIQLIYAQTSINFLSEQEFEKITTEGPVYIDFYTTWCRPCKEMDAKTFSNPEVAVFYNQNFTCFKIDVESLIGAKIASKYNIQVYPTSLYLNDKKEVISKVEGFVVKDNFIQIGRNTIKNQIPIEFENKGPEKLYEEIIRQEKLNLDNSSLLNKFFNELTVGTLENEKYMDLLYKSVSSLDYDNKGYKYFIEHLETLGKDSLRCNNLLYPTDKYPNPIQTNSNNKLNSVLLHPINTKLRMAVENLDTELFGDLMSVKKEISIKIFKNLSAWQIRNTCKYELQFYLKANDIEQITRLSQQFKNMIVTGQSAEDILLQNEAEYKKAKQAILSIDPNMQLSSENERTLNDYYYSYIEDLDLLIMAIDKINYDSKQLSDVKQFREEILLKGKKVGLDTAI